MMPAFNDYPEKPGRRRTPKRKWKRKRRQSPRGGGLHLGVLSFGDGSSGSLGQPWAAGKEARLC